MYGYTKREIRQLSSPACSPRYEVIIPAGTRCYVPQGGHAYVEDTAKVRGSNAHDLAYYYVWVNLADVEVMAGDHSKPTYDNQLWNARKLLGEKGRDAVHNPYGMI